MFHFTIDVEMVYVKLAAHVNSTILKRIIKVTWLASVAMWHVQKDIVKFAISGKVVEDASEQVNANIFTMIQNTRKVELAKLRRKSVT